MTISYKAQKKCVRLTEYPTGEESSHVGEAGADACYHSQTFGNNNSSPCLLSSIGYQIVFEACKIVYQRIGAFGRKDVVAEVESHKEWDWKGDDPTIRRYVGGLASQGYLIKIKRDTYIIGGKNEE